MQGSLQCRSRPCATAACTYRSFRRVFPAVHALGRVDVFGVARAGALVVVEIGIVDVIVPLLVLAVRFVGRELRHEERGRVAGSRRCIGHVIGRGPRLDTAAPVRATELLEQGEAARAAGGGGGRQAGRLYAGPDECPADGRGCNG